VVDALLALLTSGRLELDDRPAVADRPDAA
jgi:hypothetical protein